MRKLGSFFKCFSKPTSSHAVAVQENYLLKDKVAVVTGGGRGIGRAIVLKLAASGMKVCFCARNQLEIDMLASRLKQDERVFMPQCADVTKLEDVRLFAENVKNKFGQIFLLVNNVGGNIGGEGVLDVSPGSWENCVGQNLFSAYYATTAFVPLMNQENGGQILNIGSGVGHFPNPKPSNAYSVAKAGLWMFTRCVAAELQKKNINVNEILPGPVGASKTDYVTGGDYGDWVKKPEEVAELVFFLASQKPGTGPTGQSFSLHRRPI